MNTSIFTKKGDGKFSLNGINVNKFVKSLVNNRVLDIYLKYMGIKLLSTATLVPFALILGNNTFENTVKEIIRNDQNGGSLIPKNLPVLDDELLGNYLKIMGVTTLSVAPNTLLPLGVLMIVYQMFESQQKGGKSKNQKGGRVTMPSQYFNPTNMETYVPEVPPTIGKSWPNPPNKVTQYNAPKQTGGVGLATGFLGKNVTNLSNVLKGQPITYPPLRGLPEYNNSLQLNNRTGPTLNTLDTVNKAPVNTNRIAGYNVHPDGTMNGSVLMGGKKSTKKKSKGRKQKAGGSDWSSTLYSRGPVNSPDMSKAQFDSFNKSAPYLPNSELSSLNPSKAYL